MDKLQNFVIWLDGFIDAAGSELDSAKTKIVKDKLNVLFEHEAEKVDNIEPQTYPSMDYDMRNINGIRPSEDDVLIRC